MNYIVILLSVLVVTLLIISIILLYLPSRKKDMVEEVKHVLEEVLE